MLEASFEGTLFATSASSSLYLWQWKTIWQRHIQGLLPIARDQKPLFVTHPPTGQWSSWGCKLILTKNDQDSTWRGKGDMVWRTAKCVIGISNDALHTYKRNTLSSCVWKWSHNPSGSWINQLQSGPSWRREEWRRNVLVVRSFGWS